jgi:hypothetical protein
MLRDRSEASGHPTAPRGGACITPFCHTVLRRLESTCWWRSAPFAASHLLEMLGAVLTRGQRRMLAAADLLMPLLKLLAATLYLPVLVDAER